jgi:hypothetical protein
MGGVLDFLGEKVAGVNNPRNVSNFYCLVLMLFADTALVEVDVLGALEGDRGGPVDGGLVVVVDGDGFGRIGHTEVEGTIFNGEKIVDAFVCSVDLGDTRAVGCLVLSEGFPCNGATGTADEITR